MSDDGDDPSFDIGDVYGGESVEHEPAKKKKKAGFGFKFPQFMKREKKPATVAKKHSVELDFEEVYERGSRQTESANPMTSEMPLQPGQGTPPRGSVLQHHPSSELNFAEAYDKPPPLQFEDNPSSREKAGQLKSTPSGRGPARRNSPPPSRGSVLQHHPSSELNFAEAYDKPPPLQFEDNPSSREKAGQLHGTRPKNSSPPRSSPGTNSPKRAATPRKSATPPRGVVRKRSGDVHYSDAHKKTPPGPLGVQENPHRPRKSTGGTPPAADFSFLVKERSGAGDMDEELGQRLPTKVKPGAAESKKKEGKGSLNTFFGLFRASRKSAEINRSESAALERLKSLSQSQDDALVKPTTQTVDKPAKPDDASVDSRVVLFDENDPNAPILISMKENLQFQANKTIAFATRDAFDHSIQLSVEMVNQARHNYEASDSENQRARGIHLAGLLEALADIYKSIGRFDEAAKCLVEAVAARRTVRGGAQPLAAAFTDLGLVYCEMGRYEEAYDCFEQAHKILTSYHEDGKHPDIASTYGNLSVCLRGLNQNYDSVNMGERAVKLMEELCGKNDLNTLQQKVLISLSLLLAGDPALSVRTLTEVINAAEKKLGMPRDHPWLNLVYHEHQQASLVMGEAPEGSTSSYSSE